MAPHINVSWILYLVAWRGFPRFLENSPTALNCIKINLFSSLPLDLRCPPPVSAMTSGPLLTWLMSLSLASAARAVHESSDRWGQWVANGAMYVMSLLRTDVRGEYRFIFYFNAVPFSEYPFKYILKKDFLVIHSTSEHRRLCNTSYYRKKPFSPLIRLLPSRLH